VVHHPSKLEVRLGQQLLEEGPRRTSTQSGHHFLELVFVDTGRGGGALGQQQKWVQYWS
jgi:hypothetical protein